MLKPKECVNENCNRVMYVPDYKLHMCLQCDHCIARRKLAHEIADQGGWEEFHQRRYNFTMYDYHKNRRLTLEREYRARYQQPRPAHYERGR